jgi:hypothetical protein
MENPKKWSLSPLIRIFVVILVLGAVGLSVMAFASNAANDKVLAIQDDEGKPDTPPMPFFGKGGFRGFGHHGWFGPGQGLDYDAFLADALGISVQELQEAYAKANDAMLDEAVAKGYLTQEQADLIKARYALMQYIDKDELMAKALGISVEKLQAAREEDKSLSTLLDELGLEPADARKAMQTAYEEAVKDAVGAGVITQDQADKILSGEYGSPMFGGKWGFRDREQLPRGEYRRPCEPGSDTTTGTSL